MSSLWDDWIISSIPEASNLGQHADTRWPLEALLTHGTHNLLSDTSYTPSLIHLRIPKSIRLVGRDIKFANNFITSW